MADEPESSGGSNVFTRKIGPLPMWGWMGIALLLAILYYLYQKNQASSTSSTSTTASVNTPGGVDSSLVPQFINQNYTTVNPPSAPATTTSTTGSTGSTGSTSSTGSSTATSVVSDVLTAGHIISPSPGKATVGWTNGNVNGSGATQLQVVINGPGVAKNQTRYIPASATTATFEDLEPNHDYVVQVTPVDSSGQAVGSPGIINLVTSSS